MANNNDKFISRENAKTLWGYMIDLLTGKQNKLTFDETPTQSSDNPVKSGGIFTALAGKGTYSKPQNGIPKTDLENAVQTSLGLADSALQSETDPTVPSWAKQSSKPSYNSDEISDTNREHKFATQSQLNQISTNQTNILYALQTGAKNLLTVKYCDYVNIASVSETGIVTINASAASSDRDIHLANRVSEINKFVPMPQEWIGKYFSGIITAHSTVILFMEFSNNGTSWTAELALSSSGQKIVIPNYPYYKLTIKIGSGTTLSNYTVVPMVADEVVYNTVGGGQPQSLPNCDLTALEAEDREALAEEIDAGAKNIIDWTKNGTKTESGVTFTPNTTTGAITVTGTASANVTYDFNGRYLPNTFGGMILTGTPTGTTFDFCIYVAYSANGSSEARSDHVYESNQPYTIRNDYPYIRFFILVMNGTNTGGKVFYPMLCTLADWKVSQKIVPYRLPYQTLGNLQWKTYEVSLASVSFIKSGGGLYYYYFSVTNDFSEVLSVTIAGFSAVVNKGFSAYMEAGKIGLMVYDATDPQSLAFSAGTIWLRVVGFK